jgi:hypothetical protein
LVRDLIKDDKKRPEKFRELKEREKAAKRHKEAVIQAIRQMQIDGKPIESSQLICDMVN